MMVQPVWWILAPAVALLVATGVWAVRTWPGAPRARRAGAAVRLLLAVSAVAIALRPAGASEVELPREHTTDVLVVVDRTTSMGAHDWAGERPRMEGVEQDMTTLVTALAGARFSVVVFDDDARVAVPFTHDVTTLAGFWRTVGWRPSAKASGSDVSVAAEVAQQVLAQSAEQRPGHTRHLVYVGDGEQTAGTEPGSWEALADLVDTATVLGYGTEAGGRMTAGEGDTAWLQFEGQDAVSSLDADNLERIAAQLGGTYVHRSAAGDLPPIVPPGDSAVETRTVPGEEYYWIVALGAGAGLLVLLAASVRRARTAREEVRGAA